MSISQSLQSLSVTSFRGHECGYMVLTFSGLQNRPLAIVSLIGVKQLANCERMTET